MGVPKLELDQKIADEICDAISTGSIGLKRLCKANPHWPSHETIYQWLYRYPHFADSYTRAKQNQIESFIDDVIEIADDASNDWIVNERGTEVPNHEHVHRARLRIDTRKWLASKLVPRLYGERNPKTDDNQDAISKVRVEDEG